MKSASKNRLFVNSFIFLFVIIFIRPILLQAVTVGIDLNSLQKAKDVVLVSDKDIPQSLWTAGQYLKAGVFKDVVSICEKILKVQKNNIDAHSMMAAAYKGLKDEDKYQKKSL